MTDDLRYRDGFADILPVMIAASPYAVLLGALAASIGVTLGQMFAMSALVFAGGSQFVIVDLLEEGAAALTFVIAVFAVNLRHTLMGLSLTAHLAHLDRGQPYLWLAGMTDEVWAIALARSRSGRRLTNAYWAGMSVSLWVFWVTATCIGVLVGQVLPDPQLLAADFAFAVIFIILLMGLYEGRRDVPPWVAAGLAAHLGDQAGLPSHWVLVLCGTVGAAVGAIFHKPLRKEEDGLV